MKLGVGLKWGAIAAIVLVVGWTLYLTIQYIQDSTEERILRQLQRETNEQRDKVDESVNTAPDNVDDSLQFLRDRDKE